MILWEHQAQNGWAHDPLLHLGGKRLEKWVPPELIKEITVCFAPYYSDETWKSLLRMMEIFKSLAQTLAKELEIAYPEKKEKEIRDYFSALRQRIERG